MQAARSSSLVAPLTGLIQVMRQSFVLRSYGERCGSAFLGQTNLAKPSGQL